MSASTCPHCGGATKEIPGFNEVYVVCANKGRDGTEKTCDESEEVRKRRTAAKNPTRGSTGQQSPQSSTPGSDVTFTPGDWGPWPHLFNKDLGPAPGSLRALRDKIKSVTQRITDGDFDVPLWPPGSKLQVDDPFEARIRAYMTFDCVYRPYCGVALLGELP